jgi:hypothetical protein
VKMAGGVEAMNGGKESCKQGETEGRRRRRSYRSGYRRYRGHGEWPLTDPA